MSTQEQAPGQEPARKSSFDQADRDRIRAALFRYMEEHRVGVPTLIAHMAKAVKREARYIPQKTLQRFLAGEMRTNDASVSIFHEFARTLPPARDELGELSLALGAFFKPPLGLGVLSESAPIPAGLFQTYVGSPPANEKVVISRLAVGFMTVSSHAPQRPARIQERAFAAPLPPAARPGEERETGERGEHFEGALVHFGAFYVGVLRSTATRRPRIHWLTRDDSTRLWSLCQSARLGDAQASIPTFEQMHLEHLGEPRSE